MRITRRQLRKVIREALLLKEGYSVPNFPNSASMEDWLDELVDEDPDAEVDDDVINPETGMLLIPAGESASEQPWFADRDDYDPYADAEGVAKMAADEPEDSFDYEAYEAEMEAKAQKEREASERIQDMVTQQAVEAGQDWAADTLYDAENSPSMWQRGGYSSAKNYVMSAAESAAGDIADSLLRYGEHDVAEWYNNLPSKEDPYSRRPSKFTMKDIVADYFFDGASKALSA